MLNKVVDQMKAYGGIAGISQILTTSNGQDITRSTSDGTAEEGELLGENTAASEQDVEFGTAILGAKNCLPKLSVYPMNCCRTAGLILNPTSQPVLRSVSDAVRLNIW